MLLFKIGPKQETTIGQTRTVTKFAFFPTTMDDGSVIWLEKYLTVQRYGEYADFVGGSYFGWETIKKERIRRKNEDVKS